MPSHRNKIKNKIIFISPYFTDNKILTLKEWAASPGKSLVLTPSQELAEHLQDLVSTPSVEFRSFYQSVPSRSTFRHVIFYTPPLRFSLVCRFAPVLTTQGKISLLANLKDLHLLETRFRRRFAMKEQPLSDREWEQGFQRISFMEKTLLGEEFQLIQRENSFKIRSCPRPASLRQVSVSNNEIDLKLLAFMLTIKQPVELNKAKEILLGLKYGYALYPGYSRLRGIPWKNIIPRIYGMKNAGLLRLDLLNDKWWMSLNTQLTD